MQVTPSPSPAPGISVPTFPNPFDSPVLADAFVAVVVAFVFGMLACKLVRELRYPSRSTWWFAGMAAVALGGLFWFGISSTGQMWPIFQWLVWIVVIAVASIGAWLVWAFSS